MAFICFAHAFLDVFCFAAIWGITSLGGFRWRHIKTKVVKFLVCTFGALGLRRMRVFKRFFSILLMWRIYGSFKYSTLTCENHNLIIQYIGFNLVYNYHENKFSSDGIWNAVIVWILVHENWKHVSKYLFFLYFINLQFFYYSSALSLHMTHVHFERSFLRLLNSIKLPINYMKMQNRVHYVGFVARHLIAK